MYYNPRAIYWDHLFTAYNFLKMGNEENFQTKLLPKIIENKTTNHDKREARQEQNNKRPTRSIVILGQDVLLKNTTQ